MESKMTRGELADRADVNAETIRYYENRDLLPEPSRSAAGYRMYDDEDVARLRFIKRAQELGFTLAEVSELLTLRRENSQAEEVRIKASEKLQEVDRKIGDLQLIRSELADLVTACSAAEASGDDCPILRNLDGLGEFEGGETS